MQGLGLIHARLIEATVNFIKCISLAVGGI